jgi:hypothetical protein
MNEKVYILLIMLDGMLIPALQKLKSLSVIAPA